MQRPEPGLPMACHPFVGDAGVGLTATAPAEGQLDPSGELGPPTAKLNAAPME